MSAPAYRFAVISDVHIDLEDGGKKTYFIYARDNFEHALRSIKKLGCDFIISAGDQVTNASGAGDEWLLFQDIVKASGYDRPVFTALGNHETRFSLYGCTLEESLGEFRRLSGIESLPVNAPSGKCYYEYTEPKFGDSFIFMALENGPQTNLTDNFSAEQMAWAEELIDLRLSQGRRVFLIQHAGIYGFGAGDDIKAPVYKGAIRTEDEDGKPFVNNRRFKELVKRHKELIWFFGHSHVGFADGVYYSACGESCRTVHIPALAGTTRIIRGEGSRLDRTFCPGEAQGYLAEVYEDRTVFRGYNFYDGTPYKDIVLTIERN